MTKEKGSVKESKVFLRGRDSGISQRVTASEKLKIGWRAKMWKTGWVSARVSHS